MNSVETILFENSDKDGSLFIFPTDVAASRWADHLLRLRRGGTVAMEKFIAWDTFKQNSIRSKVQDRQSIPSVLRKMFVCALIKENAELCAPHYTESETGSGDGTAESRPIFSSLIRVEWAAQADSYAAWLTGILPQLGVWFRQAAGLPISGVGGKAALEAAKNFSGDERDLFCLALRYAQFLEKHNLFEPAWEIPPFDDTGKECFIFFPESLSDFSEYKDLLAASGHVKTVRAGDVQDREVYFYTNSRSEITEAALYILALNRNRHIPWDSISVSIPDADSYSPYLLREFDNRNIPYIMRSGKDLASYPAGQFFTALGECCSSDFSFKSLAALLLDRRLPWKNSEDIEELIDFGMRNNCIVSWIEDDGGGPKRVNVWDDAFAHPFGGVSPGARRFFNDLRRRAKAMRNAASFQELRKHYFSFRERFFDMEKCLSETDLILSRCISELMKLAEIEKSFPDVKVPDPYNFFTGYLGEVNYLAQKQASGVVIFPYRTAAPAPFECHIVLGASQANLTSVFSPLAFLARSKREKLGITDNDASLAFINLHQFNSALPAAFFCSEQTFSGYAIPHSALEAARKPQRRFGGDAQSAEKFAGDLYRGEEDFYASLYFPGQTQAESAFPLMIHKNQKQGFENWRQRRKHLTDNGNAVSAGHPLLDQIRSRLCRNENYKNKFSVSPSSLRPYFQCAASWIFERILELEDAEVETGLMASNTAGQVYHAVINLFLEDIKKTGKAIAMPADETDGDAVSGGLPETYRRLLAEKVEEVFDSFPRLPAADKQEMSMLTARLLRAEKKLFYTRLEKFFAEFIGFFGGYHVLTCESYYSLEKDFYALNGIVDCILLDARKSSPDKDSMVIVDFKTKNMPALADCLGEERLADFQLPLYLSLAEAAYNKEAHTALFFSIINAEPEPVIGSIKNAAGGYTIPKKEEDWILRGGGAFADIMNEFGEKAEQFASEIRDGTFSFFPSDPELCIGCGYNRVCRTLYIICRGENRSKNHDRKNNGS